MLTSCVKKRQGLVGILLHRPNWILYSQSNSGGATKCRPRQRALKHSDPCTHGARPMTLACGVLHSRAIWRAVSYVHVAGESEAGGRVVHGVAGLGRAVGAQDHEGVGWSRDVVGGVHCGAFGKRGRAKVSNLWLAKNTGGRGEGATPRRLGGGSVTRPCGVMGAAVRWRV